MFSTTGSGPQINRDKEVKFRGIYQGYSTVILEDISKDTDLNEFDIKIFDIGKTSHNNEYIYNLFELYKGTPIFGKINKGKIIFKNIIDLNGQDIKNKTIKECKTLSIGIGPGGGWLTQYKAAHIGFDSMILGFEINDDGIEIKGVMKTCDLIHGNSIFKKEIQKKIISNYYNLFNYKSTYYTVIYKPEKKSNFFKQEYFG